MLKRDNSKQVFYYDDFLGHNEVEILKARGGETALIYALKLISNNPNKKLILTTRSFILNSAVESSEKLRIFNIKAKESIIELDEYTTEHKLRLLSNHIQESSLEADLKSVLDNKRIQSFIVTHRNFSPRSVEFITTPDKVSNFSPQEFEDFIIQNFDKPDEIWRHAYEQQINDYDRLLLNTMVSFGDGIDLEPLELAFNARLQYEVHHGGFTHPTNAFLRSFQRLEGGFIVQEYVEDQKLFKFINPSLVDFLTSYIGNTSSEITRIGESALFLRQITTRILPIIDKSTKVNGLSDNLIDKLLNNNGSFLKKDTFNEDSLTLAIMLHYYIDLESSEPVTRRLLHGIDDWVFLKSNEELLFAMKSFLREVKSAGIISDVRNLGIDFFKIILLTETSILGATEYLKLIVDKFEPNLPNIIKEGASVDLEEIFTDLLNQKILDDIDDTLSYANAQDFIDAKEEESVEIQDFLEKIGIKARANFSEFGNYDWRSIGNENYFQEQMEKDD